MSAQADGARAKVIHCETLDDKQKAKMLLLINTKPDTTLPVFTGVPDFLLGHTLSMHLEELTAGRLAEALDEEGSAPSKKAKTGTQRQTFSAQQPRFGSVSAWVSSVLGQIPKNVPMEQVQQFLTLQVSPIPCSVDVSSRLVQSFEQWEGQVEATGLYLDGLFGGIIAEGFKMEGSEQMTLVGTEICIGYILEILRVNAPRGPLSLRLDHDRDSIVSNTSSASYAHGCRPDSYFIVNERLLLVGEDKAMREGITAATDDLRKKSISLAQSHYGSLSYILAYAASGFNCDIHLMNTDGEVLSLGLQFDLRSMQDRAALLVTVINMYRLLLSMRDQLPALENLMPDNIWVLRPQHHTQVMHVPSKQGSGGRFHKRTEASFYDHVLQQLGSSRADNFALCALGTTENGLVTCQVSVTRKKVIHVMPALGPSLEDCPPKLEQEFKAAARCIAKAMYTLHSSKGAHHDVRAANICWRHNSRQSEAVVVDLSTCGPVDTSPAIKLKDWTPLGLGAEHQDIPTLSPVGAYTQYSDMHQIGLMLSKFSKGLPWESNSNDFCQALQSKQLTASQMLVHAYLNHA